MNLTQASDSHIIEMTKLHSRGNCYFKMNGFVLSKIAGSVHTIISFFTWEFLKNKNMSKIEHILSSD